jgi:hypothetical protein
MNATRFRARISAVVVFVVLLGAVARAQSYGPGDQVLTIGAADLRPENEDLGGWLGGADGYLSTNSPAVAPAHPTNYRFRAPLSVPDGARVTRLCLWVHDTDSSVDAGATLLADKLTYGGQTPFELLVGPYVSSSLAPGYRSYCSDLDQTVAGTFDIDNDGTPDPVAWYVRADLWQTSFDLGIGGVQVTWRRQVSAPPGTPTFGDVADSHPFYQFIEALAASGMTGGCGGGNYCPGAPLTRGQMAVFLAKALGLHWPS